MDRAAAFALLKEHAKSEVLIRHGLAVEACMRAYARKLGGGEDLWGIVGLLHDFDWEICATPEEHPQLGARILEEKGYPEAIVRAVLSHGNHTGVLRESLMEKALFAVDELSGLVIAVALVRPAKSLAETDAPSVRRKMKDKAFARSVNRDDILQGAQELGVDLDQHIEFVVQALRPVAPALGLRD